MALFVKDTRQMIEFEETRRTELPGGRVIFSGPAPFEMDRDKPEIVGKIVRIRGCVYLVKGCERYLPNRPITRGEMIGLLVVPAPLDIKSAAS